ncbi:hypothetical protein BOTCAL_0411g00150 [Botryotinia calthae]|uniref:Uncharacterized protein n=1 Tax=Botryotinia calthae TaxID=38488 RepID=A0A4Y8CSJ9_9HELO|nr:hypothetical protein BOTCAL_0411g00150 [Botryotinia calthae]
MRGWVIVRSLVQTSPTFGGDEDGDGEGDGEEDGEEDGDGEVDGDEDGDGDRDGDQEGEEKERRGEEKRRQDKTRQDKTREGEGDTSISLPFCASSHHQSHLHSSHRAWSLQSSLHYHKIIF